MKVNFEHYKDKYSEEVERSIAFAGRNVEFFTEAKARHLLNITERHLGDLKNLSALDVGCGVGLTGPYLTSSFGSLHGVDITEGVIMKAAETNPLGHYQVYDSKELPFPDASFDVVFCDMRHASRTTH